MFSAHKEKAKKRKGEREKRPSLAGEPTAATGSRHLVSLAAEKVGEHEGAEAAKQPRFAWPEHLACGRGLPHIESRLERKMKLLYFQMDGLCPSMEKIRAGQGHERKRESSPPAPSASSARCIYSYYQSNEGGFKLKSPKRLCFDDDEEEDA